MSAKPPGRRRALTTIAIAVTALVAVLMMVSANALAGEAPKSYGDGLGVGKGKIKHVWLIILENKSYDATFTGLNNNTYLWQTLPEQGVLLKNYYGTGHFSLDNYVSMVSGQATQPDTQDDCPYYDKFSGTPDMSGKLKTNPNYGQMESAAGPNAAAGSNGCVYPASVPTLFNQLDAAHVSWKGYAQDLGNPDESGPVHDAGRRILRRALRRTGADRQHRYPNPGTPTAPTSTCPSTSPSRGLNRSGQPGDCNEAHIANLFSSDQRALPRPAERGHHAGVQLDLAEQLQRRPRRGVPRQQPLGRLLQPDHAEPNRSTTPAGCTPPTCSSNTSSPRSRNRRRSRKAA